MGAERTEYAQRVEGGHVQGWEEPGQESLALS